MDVESRLDLANEYGTDMPIPSDMQLVRDCAIRLEVYSHEKEDNEIWPNLQKEALKRWPLMQFLQSNYQTEEKTYAKEIKKYIKLLHST